MRPAEIGAHVSAVLTAADAAATEIRRAAVEEAQRIRDEALAAAADIIRAAEARADVRVTELRDEAERMRREAEEEARDLRLAVDAYAKRRRTEADEEARATIAAAEAKARSLAEAAQERLRLAEEQASARRQELAGDMRRLQERHDRTIQELRRLASYLEDALADVKPTGIELPETLNVEARRFGRNRPVREG